MCAEKISNTSKKQWSEIKYFKINIPDGVICRDRIEPEEPFNTLIFLLLIRKSHNANPPKNICIKKNYQ